MASSSTNDMYARRSLRVVDAESHVSSFCVCLRYDFVDIDVLDLLQICLGL